MVITSPSTTAEWHNLTSQPPSSLSDAAVLPAEKLDSEIFGRNKKPLQSSKSSLSNTLSDGVTVEWKAGDSSAIWDGDLKSAHATDVQAIANTYHVNPAHGLTQSEADIRLERDGPNQLESAGGVSAWRILLRQVSNSLTIVLLLAMALSYGTLDFIEGAVITAVIVLNIVLGFVQDFKAEKEMKSLQGLAAPACKVLRDKKVQTIKSQSLVCGDVVYLDVGNVVPSDLRLIDGVNLEIDESPLTGESLPITKTPNLTMKLLEMPLGDRTNCAYSGTTVTKGRGVGIVIAIGMKTEVGRIAEMLQDKRISNGRNAFVRFFQKLWVGIKHTLGLIGTPLTVTLSKFALLLFALAIMLAIIVFSVNKWDLNNSTLLYGIVVGVAVIPESLIAVLTITLAIGIKAMAGGNVIVRRMQALEAIGGITHILTDKTGTLTQGKMVARKVWVPDMGMLGICETNDTFDPTNGHAMLGDKVIDKSTELNPMFSKLLDAVALCNLSTVYNDPKESSDEKKTASSWTAMGEPTDIALQVLAMRFDRGKTDILADQTVNFVAEHPFNSAIKRMSVAYEHTRSNTVDVFVKGAGESVLPLLNSSESQKQLIVERMTDLAKQGLRVLLIATKSLSSASRGNVTNREWAESNVDFLGLVGLYDPPRLETAASIRACRNAGISCHMLTGDHIDTATAIALEIGLLNNLSASTSNSKSLIMQGGQFDALSDMEIDGLDQLPIVLARCSPATKVRMVDSMHRRKAFCVMTGDGVNDAPALKRADVGVAMGINGSDVAKEASDMVLTDDNFASIVKAVEEGRRLFDNIQKFLMHLLISNIAQVILLLIALAFKDAEGNSVFPLSPLEILWVNMITCSFCALSLGMEEKTSDVMLRPPHSLRIGVFTKELVIDQFVYGGILGSLCLVAFSVVVYGAGGGDLGADCNSGFNDTCDTVFRARATTFAVLSFLILITAWEVKHFSRSLFNLDPEKFKGPFGVFHAVWYNRFLFWAVIGGFFITFPVVYIPVVNHKVFKHSAIGWEWGVVVGCFVVYVAGIETWKAVKRHFSLYSGKNRGLGAVAAEGSV